MCECYLGIAPHWPLFKRLFIVKAQTNREDPHEVGGCNIQIDPRSGYFKMGFLDSVAGWKARWFYAKDSPNSTGEPLVNLESPVTQRNSWRNQLTEEEIEQTGELMTQIATLKEKGLTRTQLAGIFLKRRV